MGFFDWLFGKRRKPEVKPSAPKVLGGLDDDSPQLVVDMGGGTVRLMDREAYDCAYGQASGSDPAQRDLDDLLPKVTRVRAIAGGMFRGKAMGSEVVLDTSDSKELAAFRATLQIVEDPRTFSHCSCLGGPTLELLAGEELIATIGLQHGRAIRWKQWKHDAQLRAGQALNDWLTRHGIDGELLDALLHNQYDAGGMMPLGFLRGGPAPLSRAEQQVRLAELCRLRGGDLNQALARCQRVIDADPVLAFAYVIRALIHQQRGDQPQGLADFNEAIRLGCRDAEVFFARAVAHDHLGRSQEALADCTAALEIDPKHANAYNSRGLIRARLGQLEEAQGDLTEAIRLAPKWFFPHLHRAQVYHNRGQLDPALADYDQAIELMKAAPSPPGPTGGYPNLALVHCRRGEARYDHFHEAEAEEDFAEARRRDPGATAGYLGDMWLRRNKFDWAVEAFSHLVQLRRQDGSGFVGRGMAQEALGNLDQALDDYSTAIRLQAGEGPANFLRARIHLRQERRDDALADLSQHLRHFPNDPMAYLFRSSLYKQQGALAEALADLNAAHRVAPDDPQVCNNLAWMLSTCSVDEFRDGPRAVALARQACRATEWQHPYCLGTLGAACAETGEFAEAIRWQGEALLLYPGEEKPAGQARLELYRAGQRCRE